MDTLPYTLGYTLIPVYLYFVAQVFLPLAIGTSVSCLQCPIDTGDFFLLSTFLLSSPIRFFRALDFE